MPGVVGVRDMLTVRVGKRNMARRSVLWGRVLQCLMVLVPLLILVIVVLQQSSDSVKADLRRSLSGAFDSSGRQSEPPSKEPANPCGAKRSCPADHFSFYIQSGAANVVGPKICMEDKLILGTTLNNAGVGINVVIVNGKTGEVLKTGHFNMYSESVNALIEFLKDIKTGSIVMMASYDDPATKLNEEAKKLIAELGSSKVNSMKFRDSWVFVGGKGATMASNFEKHLKSDQAKNKYGAWPELIDLEGCIPKYLE